MTIRPYTAAVGAMLFGLCIAAGGASAQTGTDSMSKSGGMKSETMKTDNMKMGSTKMGSKSDCMHKAGMEKDSMKKSEMMKHCAAMK
jgi:pentapeptide MXKDX repeat protein